MEYKLYNSEGTCCLDALVGLEGVIGILMSFGSDFFRLCGTDLFLPLPDGMSDLAIAVKLGGFLILR